MLKFHLNPAFMNKLYKLKKKIFLIRVFWLKYIFRIKFKIPILDLMLLPKNSVLFEGLYSNSQCICADAASSKTIVYVKFKMYT